MNEQAFFNILLIAWFVLSAVIFVTLFFIVAPYGRHTRRSWGSQIGDKLGWVIMEAPASLLFAAFFVLGIRQISLTAVAFLVLWEAHYVHRAFIYPFSRRTGASGMAVAVVGMGFVFNMGNAYLNGRYLFTLSGGYANAWLLTPQFIIGAVLFAAGFFINRWADGSLRSLRKPGERVYRIPEGGLYRWISCPNYFGEMLTWTGWAVATWSLPGLAFAVFTVANLAPRARAHHQWYKQQFADYPPERKALVPAIW
jgi:3-oxo-5-alpha-steroid 4-dehydrogenase 1